MDFNTVRNRLLNNMKEYFELLKKYGYICDVDEEEVNVFFEAPTYYENVVPEVELDALAIHELIELCELKKMDLSIDYNIFIKHRYGSELAHIKSLKVELPIAMDMDWRKFIKVYCSILTDILGDPETPSELKGEYLAVQRKYCEAALTSQKI